MRRERALSRKRLRMRVSTPSTIRTTRGITRCGWEHLIARATANSKQFPFTNPQYKGNVTYDASFIPNAETLLGRTLFMTIPVKMSEERMESIVRGIETAGAAGEIGEEGNRMIIVTGGAGFIGSAFVWKLNQEGVDDILIVDNLGTSDKWRNLVPLRFTDYLPKDRFQEMILADRAPM